MQQLKKITGGFLVTLLLIPTFFGLAPKPVYATYPVHDALTYAASSISASADSITSTSNLSLQIKEYALDTIAFGVVNIILDQMAASVVNWINSGFEGNPAFVTDLEGFLVDVADEELGKFIEGSDLAFLCSPFQLQVKLSLLFNKPFQEEARCTLSDVSENIDAFLGGDFRQGGWDGWFELVTKDQNSPYGSFLLASNELSLRTSARSNAEVKLLEFGSGFFSFEKCDEINGCQTLTPGSVIENQLNDTLDGTRRRIEVADELNEIVTALFSQLVKEVITGGGGLSGVSRSSAGNSSFINQTVSDDGGLAAQKENILRFVRTAIDDEVALGGVKEATLARVLASESLLNELHSCYAGKIASNSLTPAEEAEAEIRMAQASSTIASQIEGRKFALTEQINLSAVVSGRLTSLQSEITQATNLASVEATAREFSDLQRNQALHTAVHVTDAQTFKRGVESELNAVDEDTRTKIEECEAFPKEVDDNSNDGA